MRFGLRDPAPPVSVAAWRELARKRLPDMAWQYIESAADDGLTRSENETGFARWRLRQRSLAGVSAPRMSVEMAGQSLALPVALAPTGAAGISHWTGDIAATCAAEARGTRAVISTAASYTLEEIARATDCDHWFQLYPFGDRGPVQRLMARAAAA
ncbi:alpha-hydroxy-acid oxidizing protein, partial [Mangrovimicrobium sediminis]